jgi:hypothetical protein
MSAVESYVADVSQRLLSLGVPRDDLPLLTDAIEPYILGTASGFGTRATTNRSLLEAITQHRREELPGILQTARANYVVAPPTNVGTRLIDALLRANAPEVLTGAALGGVLTGVALGGGAPPSLPGRVALAHTTCSAFIEGFLSGARAPIAGIDESRLTEIASESDLAGPATLIGILWGLGEEIVETADSIRSIYRLITEGVPPEVLQAIQSLLERLNRNDLVGLARDAGESMGESMGRDIANDISLMYREIPDDRLWRALWPQVVVGRILAPLVRIVLETAITFATAGAGSVAIVSRAGHLSTRFIQFAQRLVRSVPAPRNAGTVLRYTHGHHPESPRTSRPRSPAAPGMVRQTPENAAARATRDEDRGIASSSRESVGELNEPGSQRPQSRPREWPERSGSPATMPTARRRGRQRHRGRVRRRPVRPARRVNPELRNSQPYGRLEMRTANERQVLPEDAPRITEIGAVELPDRDFELEVRIRGTVGPSITRQGRTPPRYNSDATQRQLFPDVRRRLRPPRQIFRTAEDRRDGVPLLRNYDRAHLWGQGWGDEAFDGIMYAPRELNQRFQSFFRGMGLDSGGVERSIDDLAASARRQGGQLEVIATARSFGRRHQRGLRGRERLLQQVTYEIRINIPGQTRGTERLAQISIEVDPPRRVGGRYVPGTVHRPEIDRGRAWEMVFSSV